MLLPLSAAKILLSFSHPRFRPTAFRQRLEPLAMGLYFRALCRTQYADKKLLHDIQLRRLRQLIRHAYDTVPFWRLYLSRHRCTPPWPKSLDDFRKLPPVNKVELRTHPAESLVSTAVPDHQRLYRATTGSTGTPLQVFLDTNFFARRKAQYHRQLQWAGKQCADHVLRVLPYDYLEIEDQGTFFYCDGPTDLAEKRRKLYALLDGKPTVIHSYLSIILQLARFLTIDGISLPIRAVITHAEQLTSDIRRYLETTFNAPVYDYYACNEVHSIAQECEQRDGLHVNAELVLVEILDKVGRPARTREMGSVVLTGFENLAMPFIRYRVGDKGRFIPEACPCGRTLPRIEIEGRAISTFPLPDGRTGHLFQLFKPIHKRIGMIYQYQIIQEALRRFLLKIVPTPLLTVGERYEIVEELQEYLGSQTDIRCEFVEYISTIRGKEPVFIPLASKNG